MPIFAPARSIFPAAWNSLEAERVRGDAQSLSSQGLTVTTAKAHRLLRADPDRTDRVAA
jgi:hypothetical protein